jgi:acetyltransferase-like isoleucine patch superfamily enzyme
MAVLTCKPLPHAMVYMDGEAPAVTIGRYSYIDKLNLGTIDRRSRVVIGDFTSIAWDVTFFVRTNHHTEWITTYPFEWFPWDDTVPRPTDPHADNPDNVTVGSDVWIGKGVSVLPGVTIADGAVIAADSVVTKDVRPYAVIAGNPGREVKRRFDDATVAYLLQVKWWTLPIEDIRRWCGIICSGDIERLKQVLPPALGT